MPAIIDMTYYGTELTKLERKAKTYGGACKLFLAIIRSQQDEAKSLRQQLSKAEAETDKLCDLLAREWGIDD